MVAFVLFFQLVIPLAIIGRDPARALDLLLPTFVPIARALAPLTRPIANGYPRMDRPRCRYAGRRSRADAGDAACARAERR